MDSKRARVLFDKYTKNQCSPEEHELLERFLDSYQDNSSTSHANSELAEAVKSKVWSSIQEKTETKSRANVRSLLRSHLVRYAAAITFLGMGFYLWLDIDRRKESASLVIEDSKVILKTGTGIYNELDISMTGKIRGAAGEVIASQQRDTIIYQASKTKNLVYNELKVPPGKTFKLILSDGTFVHLNSGTFFRFPVNFIESAEREVFLRGEALFEVANDANRPFKVNTNDMDVRVLGTHFLVSSYSGSLCHAVLIEGSVAVQQRHVGLNNSSLERILEPGQKASMVSGAITIENVDVTDYLSWREGVLAFNDEPLVDILKKVERKYNVVIKNKNQRWDTMRFNGKFKDETIMDLLETFRESVGFDFQITENEVIIY